MLYLIVQLGAGVSNMAWPQVLSLSLSLTHSHTHTCMHAHPLSPSVSLSLSRQPKQTVIGRWVTHVATKKPRLHWRANWKTFSSKELKQKRHILSPQAKLASFIKVDNCRVVLEVNQPTGSICLLEADGGNRNHQPSGFYKQCARYICMSDLLRYPKAYWLMDTFQSPSFLPTRHDRTRLWSIGQYSQLLTVWSRVWFLLPVILFRRSFRSKIVCCQQLGAFSQ